MNRIKTNTNLRLMAICLVTFSLIGISCTSLQQSVSMAAPDDLYSVPNTTNNATNNTIASNKKVMSTENWGVPNKVQNYNPNKQNSNSNTPNYSNNNQVVAAENEDYQDDQNYQDDRYLRLKVANRNRWSMIDDWGYWNDPRFNNAFYPSYMGWNSWYTGYYGASWYYPFGPSFSMGWGGYNPYNSFGYGMGWGYNDFGYGGFGYDGFGYGGFGYGGFGYGGFGYGGWNPYYAGFWNPYRPFYPGGNYYNNYGGSGGIRQQPNMTRSMQNSAVGLGAYRNNKGYNNTNNFSNTTNGNVRYTSNPTLNTNFGSLMRRVVTDNPNVNNANSFDRPARYFSNNNSASDQNKAVNNTPTPQNTNRSNNIGGNSGFNASGFNSTGTSTASPRPARSQNP